MSEAERKGRINISRVGVRGKALGGEGVDE